MATDLENLRTWKSNLLAAMAAWTGSGLKEVTVKTAVGTEVTYRSYADLVNAIKGVNDLLKAEDPVIVISRGR